MVQLMSERKVKYPYIVSWTIWNRDSPEWRPIYKYQKCSTEDKANRLKKNLLSQTTFIDVEISKII